MEKRWFIMLFIFVLAINTVFAQKLEIDIKEGNAEKAVFTINLYDDSNNKIFGQVDYIIEDYYTDIMEEARVNSGEEVIYYLPNNPNQGPWKINAIYGDVKTSELFQVGELEKVDIRLEEDSLVIENIGNTIYDRNLLISIGDSQESIRIFLEVGGKRKIRLTAPPGEYSIRINDGTNDNNLVFSGVSLTGNAVGLEKVMEGNFFERYPLVSLFLLVLVMVVVVVFILKVYKFSIEDKKVKKNIKKLARKLR
jgi:hypothetical protein